MLLYCWPQLFYPSSGYVKDKFMWLQLELHYLSFYSFHFVYFLLYRCTVSWDKAYVVLCKRLKSENMTRKNTILGPSCPHPPRKSGNVLSSSVEHVLQSKGLFGVKVDLCYLVDQDFFKLLRRRACLSQPRDHHCILWFFFYIQLS